MARVNEQSSAMTDDRHPRSSDLSPTNADLDYFVNTLRHLAALGIRERALERLAVLIGPHLCRGAGGDRRSACASGLIAVARSRAAPARGTARQPFGYRLRLQQ